VCGGDGDGPVAGRFHPEKLPSVFGGAIDEHEDLAEEEFPCVGVLRQDSVPAPQVLQRPPDAAFQDGVRFPWEAPAGLGRLG